MLFQTILISTGNLSFLNWLTIVPSVWFFDDRFLARFFPPDTVARVAKIQAEEPMERNDSARFYLRVRQLFHWVLGGLIAYLSLPTILNLMSAQQVMNTSFEPFRIVNTYGAFGRWSAYISPEPRKLMGDNSDANEVNYMLAWRSRGRRWCWRPRPRLARLPCGENTSSNANQVRKFYHRIADWQYSRCHIARVGDESTLHHLTIPLPPRLAHVVRCFPELPTGSIFKYFIICQLTTAFASCSRKTNASLKNKINLSSIVQNIKISCSLFLWCNCLILWYSQNPWLLHLMGKMLEGDPIVDSLLAHNPFQGGSPPVRIRARHYKVTWS